MKNLDLLAAQTAQGIIDETRVNTEASAVENLITKDLGVLQENGVYAGLLYLYSRTNDTDGPIAKKTAAKLLSVMPELGLNVPANASASTALKFLTEKVCEDLDRLLLVKKVWEQTLIYTRYGAKARGVEDKAKAKIGQVQP